MVSPVIDSKGEVWWQEIAQAPCAMAVRWLDCVDHALTFYP